VKDLNLRLIHREIRVNQSISAAVTDSNSSTFLMRQSLIVMNVRYAV